MAERALLPTDTIELLKYEISVDGRGIIDGGRLREAVTVGKKNLNVRKAYAPNGVYKVGWVYDYDVTYCMICMSEFGWFIRRHHCRACGYVVCGECSKYRCKMAGLPEELESRICCNCYTGNEISPGGRFSPTTSFSAASDGVLVASSVREVKVEDNIYGSPIENDMQRPQLIEKAHKRVANEEFDRLQARNYAHAYRVMRGIVPPDVTSTNLSLMLRQGLPPLVAKRVWTCGALWLICMHSADIAKIHIADLRSRYATVGLDIVEMRAIWNILPKWSLDDPVTQAKAEWRNNFKIKLDSLAWAEMDGTLTADEKRHPVYAGEEPILIYNHRIPLDAKYDKIDTYGHVIYTGIDESGNPSPLQFYEDPNPMEEQKAVATGTPIKLEDVSEQADESIQGTPSTLAQELTPQSSPFASPVVTHDVSSLQDRKTDIFSQPASTKGQVASKYKEHLESIALEAPPPPVTGSIKASPRRRPPPLPASGPSPLVGSTKMATADSWLNVSNMPDTPSESYSSPAPVASVPIFDPNADTPPPSNSAWKPSQNPAQRIGGGYGTAALIPDSDDEFSQRSNTPLRSPLTPAPATPCSVLSPDAPIGEMTPSLSPLVTPIETPERDEPLPPPQTALYNVTLSDWKGMVLRGDMVALNALFDKGNVGSRCMIATIDPPVAEAVANQLFMQVCREPAGLQYPKETLIILVKDFHADVNYVGSDGKSGLIALLLQPDLAAVVISLGGSILMKGRMTSCPLSICLELSDQGILDGDWIIETFEKSNNFNCMSRGDAMEYFTALIKSGRHLAASRLVGLNRVQVSASDSSKIMKECNFEKMKDSLETYELLEKLGGQF